MYRDFIILKIKYQRFFSGNYYHNYVLVINCKNDLIFKIMKSFHANDINMDIFLLKGK